MPKALTVTQFVEAVNMALSAIDSLIVEGEVADFKIVHNKWVTFSIKDEESTVPCFMTVWQLRVQIEDGMLVRVNGTPRLRNKGFFSFVIQTIQPAGEGSLKRAFELLQQKLAAEGLFAEERKRPLPRFPQHIALVTSREAAAYSDFLKVLRQRQGGLTISFIHTQVQGEDAPSQIIEALNTANTELAHLDALVLVRGGGSLEDLQAFNDEGVVRAVAASRTPAIVGVGHERDITLAEMAADVRASTPSNAAELLVLSRQEIISSITHLQSRLSGRMQEAMAANHQAVVRSMHVLQTRVTATANGIARHIDALIGLSRRFKQDIASYREDTSVRARSLRHAFQTTIQQRSQAVFQLHRILQSLSPEKVLRRGYSITRTKDGKIATSAASLTKGEVITTTLRKGSVAAKIEDITVNP